MLPRATVDLEDRTAVLIAVLAVLATLGVAAGATDAHFLFFDDLLKSLIDGPITDLLADKLGVDEDAIEPIVDRLLDEIL